MRTDGRNIDQTLGALRGEGALQQVAHLEQKLPVPQKDEGVSYYGLPLLKESVWKWPIPTYFYVGGLAGASAALAAAARLRGLRGLVRAGRFIAAGGAALSGALLIEDLGIRSRFVYMMRVFRPTSPMSLGTWLLGAFGLASGASLLPGVAGDVSGFVAGALGLPLTGYTAVLISNTAVPLWQQTRGALPPLFVASAAVSAASAMEMLGVEERRVRRLAIAAKAAELLSGVAVERSVSGRIAVPLKSGLSGALWKAAKICTAASLLLSITRRARLLAGALGTAGALVTRFAMFHAGNASARDPQATFELQRA
ncbi:MAG: NrfD/PsrC family molybdoenzyme membrane anchor subunit [Myxococcales bacterium]|nr:polysulfide reductase NrfD [Myxococcales bacterium]